MAPSFRYRYVDFGTVFTGDSRIRRAGSATDLPSVLFANELATDVGGTCWGSNEPLPVLDHHFSCHAQFPSASAAVLHKAQLIRDRFAHQNDVLWLVSHQQPDFDAFCSMYLVRWIVGDSDALVDPQRYGLHPDGWLDLPNQSRFDWFAPDPGPVAPGDRWALLLASYASLLDSRRHISCPRRRAPSSVLSAALKRGRDYLTETSGATELFDELKNAIQQKQLNPLFDSVLEDSEHFAPELTLLDREAEAYDRDLRRARKAIVYLPQSEAPSPGFFRTPKEGALREAAEIDAEHLLLADTFRIATDGIYLRDPECALFNEWARLDVESSSLAAGFEFSAIACSKGRPAGTVNASNYVFSIDPERANGRHLYTVWSRLQTKEVDALRSRELTQNSVPVGREPHREGSATLQMLLADPWFGGQTQFGVLVRTPERGTIIGPPGARRDLRDDPIAEAVRTELECPIFSAESPVSGPRVTVLDVPVSPDGHNADPRQFGLNAPLEIPAPGPGNYRFAIACLRADVPITPACTPGASLAVQIGETLWQALYPEVPGSMPADFAERHLVVTADCVGVWGDRGVAVAQKQLSADDASSPPQHGCKGLREEFIAIVSLVREIDQLTADWQSLGSPPDSDEPAGLRDTISTKSLTKIVDAGEALAGREVEVRRALASPDRDLLRRFSDSVGLETLIESLRSLNTTAAERLRRRQTAEQEQRFGKQAEVLARAQRNLGWLAVLIIGFLAADIIDFLAEHRLLGAGVDTVLLSFGGPVVLAFTAWILKPWRRGPAATISAGGGSRWILIVLICAFALVWLAGIFRLWNR
ncbi:MAG TPA: hypothetical protein VL240_01295 [Candidatus Binatia bacterium]|nr:hypothetical protein [Candidatus Binatia bacterium]